MIVNNKQMNSNCLTHAPRDLAQEGFEFIKFETCSNTALLLRKFIPQLAFRGQLGCRDVFLRFQANLEMTFSRRNWISHQGLNFSRGNSHEELNFSRGKLSRGNSHEESKFSRGIEFLTGEFSREIEFLTTEILTRKFSRGIEILTRECFMFAKKVSRGIEFLSREFSRGIIANE